MIRYFQGEPILIVSAPEGWVLGYDSDYREAVYWHEQLEETPWEAAA